MSISEEDKCPECKGEKVKEEKIELEAKLEPGVADGHAYTFDGEGNQIVSCVHSRFRISQDPVPATSSLW